MNLQTENNKFIKKLRVNYKESIFLLGIAVIIVADARFFARDNLATRMLNCKRYKSNEYSKFNHESGSNSILILKLISGSFLDMTDINFFHFNFEKKSFCF